MPASRAHKQEKKTAAKTGRQSAGKKLSVLMEKGKVKDPKAIRKYEGSMRKRG